MTLPGDSRTADEPRRAPRAGSKNQRAHTPPLCLLRAWC